MTVKSYSEKKRENKKEVEEVEEVEDEKEEEKNNSNKIKVEKTNFKRGRKKTITITKTGEKKRKE